MTIFKTLKSRSLIAGSIVLVILFIASFTARQQLFNVLDTNLKITTEFDSFRSALSSAKGPLQAIESNLYLYTILLDPSQKQLTLQYIEEVDYQVLQIKQQPLYAKVKKLNSDMERFNRSFATLEEQITLILNFRHDQRFKSISKIINSLAPQHQQFLTSFNAAVNYLDFYDEQTKTHTQELYQQLKLAWLQHVSETRLIISAKTGVLGANLNSFNLIKQNIHYYELKIKSIFKQLNDLSKNGQEDVDTTSLKSMINISILRFSYISKLLLMPYNNQMREDIRLIRQDLKPLFLDSENALTIMERRLEKLLSLNLQKNRQVLEQISTAIWFFLAFITSMFLALYLVFEFWLRKPLLNLTDAITDETHDIQGSELPPLGIEELDTLISAFNQMRIQIRNRQKRIVSILQNAGDGIITIDNKGLIESINLAAEKIFEITNTEVVGKNISIFMTDSDKTQHDGYIDRYNTSGNQNFLNRAREQLAIKSSGEVFPIEIFTNELILDDGTKLFIAVIHDITERKKNEMFIEASKEETERNNVLLTKKNNLIQDSLKQLLETQVQLVEAEKMASLGSLVAGVAHEINTPIGVCVTAGSTLDYNLTELKSLIDSNKISKRSLYEFMEDANESLRIISNNLSRAAELVKSFKQVAVDQSSDDIRTFNLKEYLDEIILNLRPKLKRTQHKIVINCDDNITLNSYPGAFSQIVTNLIMNSLIHAYDKDCWGNITISATIDNVLLEFIYSDDGKGMNKEQIKKVFDPFYTTKRGQGGSGLGMNVTYNLVNQKLNGSISCFSEPNDGTKFFIQCPIDVQISQDHDDPIFL